MWPISVFILAFSLLLQTTYKLECQVWFLVTSYIFYAHFVGALICCHIFTCSMCSTGWGLHLHSQDPVLHFRLTVHKLRQAKLFIFYSPFPHEAFLCNFPIFFITRKIRLQISEAQTLGACFNICSSYFPASFKLLRAINCYFLFLLVFIFCGHFLNKLSLS